MVVDMCPTGSSGSFLLQILQVPQSFFSAIIGILIPKRYDQTPRSCIYLSQKRSYMQECDSADFTAAISELIPHREPLQISLQVQAKSVLPHPTQPYYLCDD